MTMTGVSSSTPASARRHKVELIPVESEAALGKEHASAFSNRGRTAAFVCESRAE